MMYDVNDVLYHLKYILPVTEKIKYNSNVGWINKKYNNNIYSKNFFFKDMSVRFRFFRFHIEMYELFQYESNQVRFDSIRIWITMIRTRTIRKFLIFDWYS